MARARRARGTPEPGAAGGAELERELDRLYALPPGEFTAARDELARRLRTEGRREQADEVKRLRKPPVAAWLVNRLARERELDVRRLVKAGEALAQAQVEAAAGEPSDAFREARRDEQRALDALAKAGRELAAREGVAGLVVERATQTLRAASLTDEGRALLERGRLGEELQAPGFEALTALTGTTPATKPKQASRPARGDERSARREALQQAREQLRQLRADERQAAEAARSAEREAERAEREAATLRERADEAHAAAAAAEERRAAAERELRRQGG